MRLSGTRVTAIAQGRGFGNQLWDLAGVPPSLDLPFAESKSLVDATTGRNLVTFTRASSGTHVGSDGLIKTATTNEARFDHNPTTGESLGLLVEESRTNLLVQSEDFSTTWTTTGFLAFGSGSTVNATQAPNGLLAADLLTENSAANYHNVSRTTVTLSGYQAVSVYAKSAGRSFLSIGLGETTRAAAIFDLSNGSCLASTTNATYDNVSCSCVNFGNGWYRCVLTASQLDATSRRISFSLSDTYAVPGNGQGRVYTGDGTSGIYLWGAQLEAGAFPTSYIPTTSSTVTRSADVASISGSNFSSWYRQDEGTLFYDQTVLSYPPAANAALLHASDGTGSNYIGAFIPSGINHRTVIRKSGVNELLQNAIPAIDVLRRAEVAIALKENNSNSAGNGIALLADTSCQLPAVDRLTFGEASGGVNMSTRIRRLTYWPQRLPNETLQTITQ